MRPLGSPRTLRFAPPAPSQRFERLFQLEITHTYYTQDLGRCPGFRTVPTDASARLMASLGLVFNDEGAGFSVFFRPDKVAHLLSYLRRRATADDGRSGFWSRLTFLLELQNPEFVGVTALPIGTRQAEENLYTSNCVAHYSRDTEPALLCRGDYLGGEALRRTVNAGVELIVPATVERVLVRDISGEIVLRWTEARGQERLVPMFAACAGPFGGDAVPVAVQRVPLDFSALPHDLYSIELVDAEGAPVEAPGFPCELLYVPTASDSMVLVDMLFTQPTAKSGGVYPVPSLFAPPEVEPRCGNIAYRLPFDARHTYWEYYVVSQAPGSRLSDLAIAGGDAVFTADADPVRLPNGAEATRFTTDTPLPLRQASAQRFHLTGTRRDASGQDNSIRIAPLPVAPGAPVWPGPVDQDATGISEMFVTV